MQKRQYTKEIKGVKFNFERVTKKQAKAAYRAGLTVLWCPVNLAPFTGWGLEMPINAQNQNCDNKDFNEVYNAFCWYNCNNETGKYPAFYIPVVAGLYGSFADDITKTYDYRFLEV